MNPADKLNFRGKYKQYDADGKPYLYKIGDVVEYRNEKFVAIKATSFAVPGTTTSESTWQKLGAGGGGFYIQDLPPSGAIEGDRWYRSDVSVMFTLINQENNLIWVEL